MKTLSPRHLILSLLALALCMTEPTFAATTGQANIAATTNAGMLTFASMIPADTSTFLMADQQATIPGALAMTNSGNDVIHAQAPSESLAANGANGKTVLAMSGSDIYTATTSAESALAMTGYGNDAQACESCHDVAGQPFPVDM